jgi:hypothetical protein
MSEDGIKYRHLLIAKQDAEEAYQNFIWERVKIVYPQLAKEKPDKYPPRIMVGDYDDVAMEADESTIELTRSECYSGGDADYYVARFPVHWLWSDEWRELFQKEKEKLAQIEREQAEQRKARRDAEEMALYLRLKSKYEG